KVFIREKSRLVSLIVTPILWLLIFGGGLGASVSIENVNYQTFIFPGILVQAVIFSSIFYGVYIIWDRKVDFLKEVLVAPISRTSMFMGKVLGGTTDAVIQAIILLLAGYLLGRFNVVPGLEVTLVSAFISLVILFIGGAAAAGIGLIIGSQMESPEGFQLVSGFLLFPLFFLSGALFPIDNLPAWLEPLTLINPFTYVVDGLRFAILGNSHFSLSFDILIISLFTAGIIMAGAFAFKKMKV
ncbi:ABC transporter, partial [Candidatus Parcubacteria bacterium]